MCMEDRAYKNRPGLPCTWLKCLTIFMFNKYAFNKDIPIRLTNLILMLTETHFDYAVMCLCYLSIYKIYNVHGRPGLSTLARSFVHKAWIPWIKL